MSAVTRTLKFLLPLEVTLTGVNEQEVETALPAMSTDVLANNGWL